MVPITGQASSFPLFLKTSISIQIKSKSNLFAHLSSSISRANLSCVVDTIFSSVAFLSSSISMANLSCLLVTTFSSFSFLSNTFSSPRFNLLRVARRCFLWSSVSDDLFFSSCTFFVLPLALSFSHLILSLSFLCSSVSEALFALVCLFRLLFHPC